MIIGFDLDDTIANFSETLFRYACEYDSTLRNKGIIKQNNHLIKGRFDWTRSEYQEFYKKYLELARYNLKPFENVKEVIDKLRKLNHKIEIISSRNTDSLKITREWLNKYEIEVDKLVLDAQYKGYVALYLGIDLFFDNSPEVCEDTESKGIKTYIYTSHQNKDYTHKNIRRVNNWQEIYDEVIRTQS